MILAITSYDTISFFSESCSCGTLHHFKALTMHIQTKKCIIFDVGNSLLFPIVKFRLLKWV